MTSEKVVGPELEWSGQSERDMNHSIHLIRADLLEYLGREK